MTMRDVLRLGLRKSYPIYGPNVGSAIGGSSFLRLGATGRDWKREAGDLHANEVVGVCLAWFARKLTQTQLTLERESGGEWARETDPPWISAIRTPNDRHTESALWVSTVFGIVTNGNAYLLKRRDNIGRVVGFWPVYWRHMEPRSSDPTRLVTHYRYAPIGGAHMDVPADDVVHVAYPIPDPERPALGMSPLASLVRSVATYNQAVNFEASVMSLSGWSPIILVPKTTPENPMTPERRARLRERWDELTGDRRGEPMVMPDAVDVVQPTWSPADIGAGVVANMSAARICAAIGVDPMVLGLQSENRTYSNMAEARETAIESALLPYLDMIAEQVQAEVFADNRVGPGFRLVFDRSRLRELREDEDAMHARVRANFERNIITLGEARRAIGMREGTDDPRRFADFQAQRYGFNAETMGWREILTRRRDG